MGELFSVERAAFVVACMDVFWLTLIHHSSCRECAKNLRCIRYGATSIFIGRSVIMVAYRIGSSVIMVAYRIGSSVIMVAYRIGSSVIMVAYRIGSSVIMVAYRIGSSVIMVAYRIGSSVIMVAYRIDRPPYLFVRCAFESSLWLCDDIFMVIGLRAIPCLLLLV